MKVDSRQCFHMNFANHSNMSSFRKLTSIVSSEFLKSIDHGEETLDNSTYEENATMASVINRPENEDKRERESDSKDNVLVPKKIRRLSLEPAVACIIDKAAVEAKNISL